ncbi:MAG: ABC transporter substrate-binding protein, partial [Candidatus Geothermarchaeales archaeon]
MKRVIALSIFAAALILAPGHIAFAQSTPPHDMPGPVVDTLQFRAFAREIAAASLEKGEMDLYFGGLKAATARELAGRTDLTIHRAPATFVDLVLNPAPAPEGELNPFQIKEVRQAVNYIVDRSFVANDIYRGNAEPMLSHISTIDFDYAAFYDLIKSSGITYDPELARTIVEKAMSE